MDMNICLYGASSTQIDEKYITATEVLGEAMARAGHRLVYGGGGAGLMGAAARGMKKADGYVVGVVPSFLKVDGVLYEHCDEMIYTETMRERKQIMEDRAEAFIITPGGIGTYEEFFEIYTLKQLGRHGKAIAVYNCNGYYNDLQEMLDKAISQNFMKESCKNLCEFFVDIDKMISYIEKYRGTAEKTAFLKNIDLDTRG
jgi:uncharacterized protein (TIGR00730 family)